MRRNRFRVPLCLSSDVSYLLLSPSASLLILEASLKARPSPNVSSPIGRPSPVKSPTLNQSLVPLSLPSGLGRE